MVHTSVMEMPPVPTLLEVLCVYAMRDTQEMVLTAQVGWQGIGDPSRNSNKIITYLFNETALFLVSDAIEVLSP